MVSISELASKLSSDQIMKGLPAQDNADFTITISGQALKCAVADNKLSVSAAETVSGQFAVEISAEDWVKFTADKQPRGYTTAQAIRASNQGKNIAGDLTVWAQKSVLVDRIVSGLRDASEAKKVERHANPASVSGLSPIVGRYISVNVNGTSRRIYFEEAGTGQTILCLHTAGSDSRQFRYLMEDAELTSQYRFVAFDMPWHGRSEPPEDWQTQTYALTTADYEATILGVMDALNIEKPILMGCSMGGAIALYMASKHGHRMKASFALEGGLGNAGRFVPWTNSQEVDHSHFLTSWVGGLIAPTSPSGPRGQVLWGYAQSGPGVYQGDTFFYSRDLPALAADLTPATCPVWVFSGEYDYSATTEMSQAAIDQIGGELVVMHGSGHFPMAEDPVVFKSFISPVLQKVKG